MSDGDKEFKPAKMDFDKNDAFSSTGRGIFKRETPEAIAASWVNSFTDPREHSEDRFCYLVHGFQGQAGEVIQMLYVIEGMKRGKGKNIGKKIDLLTQPHRIGDKKIISASVVDQDHRTTFGSAGLILRTPAQNVLHASPEDLGTDFVNPDRVIANSQRNVSTVDELMKASSPDKWNEVIVVGTTEAGKVSVEGFWIKVDEEGNPLDEETARQLRNIAKWDRMPLIRIVEKLKRAEFKDNRPEIHEWPEKVTEGGSMRSIVVPCAFSFNRNGIRYFLDFKKNRYSVITDEKQSRDMSPEEFAYARGVLETELQPEDKERVKDILATLPDKFDAANKPK